jgi:uncharacterized protein (TIGR00299 family) protein
MRVAYFDCYSGISGDMVLGALVDLGVDLRAIRRELAKLDIGKYAIDAVPVTRGLISGTKVNVAARRARHARTFADIRGTIASSRLPEAVRKRSIGIFEKIGLAEAAVHRVGLEEVHFHEIGAVDSIVDIVGSVMGLELLAVDAIYASPLNTGEGSVACEHGILPVPAPATLKLLEGIPCFSSGVRKELTTPTGAAIIGAYAEKFISLPRMRILNCGYGAGGHVVEELPNMLRIVVGETEERARPADTMAMVETNIDDMNPEFFEYVMEKLFAAGAADVFFTPIVMKKNRPAVKLSALVSPDRRDAVARIVLTETSSFGVRTHEVERAVLRREMATVRTPYGEVRVKVGLLNGVVAQAAPEYEECKRLARERNIPIKKIYSAAAALAGREKPFSRRRRGASRGKNKPG